MQSVTRVGEGDGQRVRAAVAEEERRRDPEPVARTQVLAASDLTAVAQERSVAQWHRLGPGGAAAGEQDEGEVVRAGDQRGHGGRPPRRRGELLLCRPGDAPEVALAGPRVALRVAGRAELGGHVAAEDALVGDDEPDLRRVQDVRELGGAVPGVGRDDDESGTQRAERGDQPAAAVRQEDGDPVTWPKSGGGVERRHAAGAVGEVAEPQPALGPDHGLFVAVPPGQQLDQCGHRGLGELIEQVRRCGGRRGRLGQGGHPSSPG